VRSPARMFTVPLAVSALVSALLVAGATPAYAAPANDNWAAAQPIAGGQGVTYGTLVGATIEATATPCGEPLKGRGWGDYSDRSVWFRWTAPTNGTLRFGIKTYGGWTAYVGVYRDWGNCIRQLQTSASSAPGPLPLS
jgi:hypothetical protein